MALFEQGIWILPICTENFTPVLKMWFKKKTTEVIIWHIFGVYKVFKELKGLSYSIIILTKLNKFEEKNGCKSSNSFLRVHKKLFSCNNFRFSCFIFTFQ